MRGATARKVRFRVTKPGIRDTDSGFRIPPLRNGQRRGLDPRRVATALYERDRIACAASRGATRPGLRFSPHLYSTMEMARVVEAVKAYVSKGLPS
jgi:hypothetical protein